MYPKIKEPAFAEDVLYGLKLTPKQLLSKYFYDSLGSELFAKIMRMPEYYLTDCELEIFEQSAAEITTAFNTGKAGFELIELGAGDGLKTKVLLEYLVNQNTDFKYVPIDISEKAVKGLQQDLKRKMPGLQLDGRVGDYFELLAGINNSKRKIVLFLGSNIGNFSEHMAIEFLRKLQGVLQPRDQLLIGFDLKKDANTVLLAYNDPHGYTAAFNLNLLSRINRELDADFQLDNFYHKETYDPKSGLAKSFLISKKAQEINLRKLNERIVFDKEESIFMERSQKYDLSMIETLAQKTGFKQQKYFFDQRKWFVNALWAVDK
ncbi:MAG: L-histidine N(alpha)-methyltransferase [Bacteroidales bacterium]|nr:L-histidine N(alpha)-methyltransferase [Bacteroidales bacterium]